MAAHQVFTPGIDMETARILNANQPNYHCHTDIGEVVRLQCFEERPVYSVIILILCIIGFLLPGYILLFLIKKTKHL